MVLLFHIPHHHLSNPNLTLRYLLLIPLDFGYLGVTLFLVVSGFCINLTTAGNMAYGGERNFSWGTFWKRRTRRLYPPYLAAVILGLAVAFPLGELRAQSVLFPDYKLSTDVLLHLFMLHNLLAAYKFGVGNGPLWSLGLEEQLYALYAVYLPMRRKLSARAVLGIVLIITLVWRLFTSSDSYLAVSPGSRWAWELWPFNFWLFWILGAVAAENYTGACRLPKWCSSLRVAVLLCLCAVVISPMTVGRVADSPTVLLIDSSGALSTVLKQLDLLSDPLFAVAFFVIVNYGVNREAAGHRFGAIVRALALVGIMSYSQYLTHVPVLHLLEACLGWDRSIQMVALRYALFIPISLVIGWAFYVLIERKFLNRINLEWQE